MKSTLSRIFLSLPSLVRLRRRRSSSSTVLPGNSRPRTRKLHDHCIVIDAGHQQQATTIFTTTTANSAKALHEQMRTAHEALKTAIQKNDTAAIDQNAATVSNDLRYSI